MPRPCRRALATIREASVGWKRMRPPESVAHATHTEADEPARRPLRDRRVSYSAGTHGADRGFIRHTDGIVANLDPPGGLTDDAAHADAEGYELRAVTLPLSENQLGDVAGYFDDSGGFVQGFVRHADGAFETFEAPGVTTGSGLGTFPTSINNKGEVTGYFYTGSIGVSHGFLMTPPATGISLPRK